MNNELTIKRTSTNDDDFISLTSILDHEFWNELGEDMKTYDQFNRVPDLSTAVIIYDEKKPIACGCFKPYDAKTVEIKRMYVDKTYRGKGISKIILHQLENWAVENGFQYAILETSIYFNVAQNLYKQAGYFVIPNYDQYKGLKESVCMRKKLQ